MLSSQHLPSQRPIRAPADHGRERDTPKSICSDSRSTSTTHEARESTEDDDVLAAAEAEAGRYLYRRMREMFEEVGQIAFRRFYGISLGQPPFHPEQEERR